MTTLAKLAPPTSVAVGDDGSASSVTDASFDISIQHETTLCKQVASERKPTVTRASPQPILLKFPQTDSKPSAIPLGIEASLSLPLVSYIHHTSPLSQILSVGDVILELDGVRSTDLSYSDMNRWFAGGSLSGALGEKNETAPAGSEDINEERTLLFLPGWNSPYNPHNESYAGPINLQSLQINEPQDNDEPTSGCLDEKLSKSITILDGPLLKRASSRGSDGYDATRQVFSRRSSDVYDPQTETEVEPNEEHIDNVSGVPYKPVRVDCSSQESVLEVLAQSDDCSMKSTCTLYLDEAGDDPGASSPNGEVDEDVESIKEAAETSSVASPVYSACTKKEEDVPVSPSTTATTYSKSSAGSSSSKGLISVEEELLESMPLPPFSFQDVLEANVASPTQQESNSITYDSSPIMMFARPSPSTISSDQDSSHNTFSSSVEELIGLSLDDGSQDYSADESVVKEMLAGKDVAASVSTENTVTKQHLTEDARTGDQQHNSSAKLESPAAAGDSMRQDDLLEQLPNAAQDEVSLAEDVPKDTLSPLPDNDSNNKPESPHKVAEDLVQREELIIQDVHRQTAQDPSPSNEEARDWEETLHQERTRSAPAFNEIAVNLNDCEDVSTIYGGKYNSSQHSTTARIEDNLIGYMESGQYHPAIYDYNTASQLELYQQDSQARKLALEEQDEEMKQAILLRLKKRHCVIEGMFAVFISLAAMLLIGIVVAVMRGKA
jgi:hypothetical protein